MDEKLAVPPVSLGRARHSCVVFASPSREGQHTRRNYLRVDGRCFLLCRTYEKRESLAKAYLGLWDLDVLLSRITAVWKEDRLGSVLREHGLDISALETDGIEPRWPYSDEIEISRVIAEVTHALAGC